jgi:hypothetical protein
VGEQVKFEWGRRVLDHQAAEVENLTLVYDELGERPL